MMDGKGLLVFLTTENIGRAIALVLFPLLSFICWDVVQRGITCIQHVRCFLYSRRRTLEAVRRTQTVDGPTEGPGVWLTRPISQPDNYAAHVAASKILEIANLKGGVGKTTIAANIGAYLARDWGKRILLIDLDFQGSLSSMTFPDGRWIPAPGKSSLATRLLSNDITPDLVDAVAKDVPIADAIGTGRLKVVTAYYDLAQADNRLLIEWLQGCVCSPTSLFKFLRQLFSRQHLHTPDVRYTLAKILHANAVREAFDLIIIDCPPRLTASQIQAFCAASHLLVPTIFDRPSSEAVASLCGQIETLKSEGICPNLKYIGIAGTMRRAGSVAQQPAMTSIRDALRADGIPIAILPANTFIPDTTQVINNADDGIAYLAMPNRQDRQRVREAFKELAECVAGQMGLQQPLNVQAAE